MESYVMFGIGVLLSIIGFLIVYVLNGIKGEIQEIKGQLGKIETDLHQRVTTIDKEQRERIDGVERRYQNLYVDVDRRLAFVEARCAVVHEVK